MAAALPNLGRHPIQLPLKETAARPRAEKWRGCMIYDTDLDIFLYSTGSAWVPASSAAVGTMAFQNDNAVAITGGTIAGVAITGGTITGAAITGGSITGVALSIDAITATPISGSTGSFTTLAASDTTTFADGATWASTGIANAVIYTTSVTTATVAFTFTNRYSSTSNGVTGVTFNPTMTSTGASSGNVNGLILQPIIGASANNIPIFRPLNLGGSIVAGYSGTINLINSVLVAQPTNSGTNPITTYIGAQFGAVSNGNGITTGTVGNTSINIAAFTAAAGIGGTVLNTGLGINMPTGVNAGTTTNIGLSITGNGQSGAATNYAIRSTSTAISEFAGQITSTLATGTAPFVVASTTNVANLNASSLSGATFAAPGAIGGGTPGTIAATTVSASGDVTFGSGNTSNFLFRGNDSAFPGIGAVGSAVTSNFVLSTKGSGGFFFDTNNGGSPNGGTLQFNIIHTAGADAYIILTGSNGSNATLNVNTRSLAITPALVCASTISCTALTVTTGGAAITGASTVTGTLSVTGITNLGTGVVNFLAINGGLTTAAVTIKAAGETNVPLALSTKGNSALGLYTNDFGSLALSIIHVASASNFVTIAPSNGGAPAISTSAGGLSITGQGTLSLSAGAANIDFFTNGALTTRQATITHTASADRYLVFTGSNGNNPSVDTSAGAFAVKSGGTLIANFSTAGIGCIYPINAMGGTAIPAGGTAGAGFTFSSVSNFGVFFGSGAPSLSAAKGSLYLRSDGSGIADRVYVNSNGTTTWTNLVTAA